MRDTMPYEKKKEEAGKTFQTLCELMTELGYKYEKNEEKLRLESNADSGGLEIPFTLEVHRHYQTVIFRSRLPFTVREDCKNAVTAAIDRINAALSNGAFGFSFQTGKIYFHRVQFFRESLVGKEAYKEFLQGALRVVDGYNGALFCLGSGFASLDGFFSQTGAFAEENAQPDERTAKRGKELFNSFCALLDEENLPYDTYEGELRLSLSLPAEYLAIDVDFEIDLRRQLVKFSSPLPFAIDEEYAEVCARAACETDYILHIGELVHFGERQTVALRAATGFKNSLLGKSLLRAMFDFITITVEIYNYKFYMLNNGMVGMDYYLDFLHDIT